MFDIKKLPELNSECFTCENHEFNWWSLLDLDFSDAMEVSNVMRCIERYAVGYCESSKLKLRPRLDSYAVMFEKESDFGSIYRNGSLIPKNCK